MVGGGMSLGCLVVSFACPRPCPPLSYDFFFFSASPWPVVCLFTCEVVCWRVRGVFFSRLLVAVWLWWVTLFSLGVVRLGGVVFRCAIGESCGRRPWCCLAQGWLSGLALGVCVFAVVWLSLPLYSVPPGWQLCLCGVGRGAQPFPFRRWVGFPRFPVAFFWGGGCLFLLLPSLSRCMHWSVSGEVTDLRFHLRVAAGSAPAPCALWLMYTDGFVARCSGSAGRRLRQPVSRVMAQEGRGLVGALL